MNYVKSVADSGLFSEIREDDHPKAYFQLVTNKSIYSKNSVIRLQGEKIDSIYVVISGSVRAETSSPEGNNHVVAIYEAGSIIGLEVAVSRSQISAMNYICNQEAEILAINIPSIQLSSYSANIERAIMYMLSDYNIKMANKIEILTHRGLRNRIMAYFHVLMGKSKSNTFTVNLSRETMAQYLCVNRSALSKELHEMKRDGVIDFKGKTFTVLERTAQ